MKGDEAKLLLGFAPNSRPSPSQVKAAYKRKVWECHPDLFPARHKKPLAESNFKLISEAHTFLLSGGNGEYLSSGVLISNIFASCENGSSKGTRGKLQKSRFDSNALPISCSGNSCTRRV
ncbi:uncharacterized protein LOC21397035 isoform X2 [Morus notabilis]|uniref:uncharacterized protein LOC21397035 isoform X2 n=1 Tax=Morus notabilis TaxID=981085 RepID=UPI000CED75A1|nr:uncharacterized protein LOC21397035 isoform X2 [Morus notabilis]